MKIKIFAVSLLIVVNSILIERFVSNQYQIPALAFPEGLISKKMQNVALAGGDSFYLSRSSISNNKLNLWHWYGNQEVIFENIKKIEQLKFKLSLESNSEIFIFWNHQQEHSSGIRIKNDKHLIFRRQEGEKILNTFVSKINYLKDTLEISLNQVGANLEVNVGGIKYLIKNVSLEGNWGLRGDESKIEVDEIAAKFADATSYIQDFRSKFSFMPFVASLLFLSLISVGVFVKFINLALYLNYILCITVTTLYFIDLRLLSVQPVESLTATLSHNEEKGFWAKIEYFRTKLFYDQEVIKKIRDYTILKYPNERIVGGPILCLGDNRCKFYQGIADLKQIIPKASKKRLVFVGTSQTVGAGASAIEKTFFSILHSKLNEEDNILSLNISQSSKKPEDMFNRFSGIVEFYKPTHVLVNLGYNRSDVSFKRVLENFFDLSKKINAKIIFIREANNLLTQSQYLEELDYFTNEKGLAVIDLYSYLRNPGLTNDVSFWWDPVHFNDDGQRLAADFILRELKRFKFIHH